MSCALLTHAQLASHNACHFCVQECADRGLVLVSHTFDGNSRLRKVTLDYFLRAANAKDAPAGATEGIDHPLIQMKAVHSVPGSSLWVMPFSNWLHQGFRLRTQLLHAKKTWSIGNMIITPSHLSKRAHASISAADLDHSNKQSFEGEQQCISCAWSIATAVATYTVTFVLPVIHLPQAG